jgi:hypothetical protein
MCVLCYILCAFLLLYSRTIFSSSCSFVIFLPFVITIEHLHLYSLFILTPLFFKLDTIYHQAIRLPFLHCFAVGVLLAFLPFCMRRPEKVIHLQKLYSEFEIHGFVCIYFSVPIARCIAWAKLSALDSLNA